MTVLPRMAAIVLNWNGQDQLERLLPGLVVQDHPDFRIVVVDNGSHDGSVDWLHETWPGIEVVALSENIRFAAGNNAGLAHAKDLGCEEILFLNNDTVVAPDLLRSLGEALAADASIGIVAPRIDRLPPTSKSWFDGGRWWPALGLAMHVSGRGPESPRSRPTDWVTGCALAIRRPLAEKLGGFDPDYYIYAEDLDLCLRARDLGVSIHYIPRSLLQHEVSASTGGHESAFKAYHKVRSRKRLLDRHCPTWSWPLRTAVLLLHDILLGLKLLSAGAPDAARALFEARRDGPETNRYPVGENTP